MNGFRMSLYESFVPPNGFDSCPLGFGSDFWAQLKMWGVGLRAIERGLVFDPSAPKHILPFRASTIAMASFHLAKFAFHHVRPVGLWESADRALDSRDHTRLADRPGSVGLRSELGGDDRCECTRAQRPYRTGLHQHQRDPNRHRPRGNPASTAPRRGRPGFGGVLCLAHRVRHFFGKVQNRMLEWNGKKHLSEGNFLWSQKYPQSGGRTWANLGLGR